MGSSQAAPPGHPEAPGDGSSSLSAGLGRGRVWWGPLLLLGPGVLFLFVFMVAPLAITLVYSLQPNSLLPPEQTTVGMGNYVYLAQRRVYVEAFARTLRLATYVAVGALLLGYPTALILRRLHARLGSTLILGLSFPILAGPLVVVLGWMLLLPRGGLVNTALVRLGLVSQPVQFIGTEVAVVIALVQFTLAFVVLNIFNSLMRIDPALVEAAGSLGADPLRTFCYVTWPLSLPGVFSGSLIAFTLAVSAFVAPHYLGGETLLVVTTLIAQFMFGTFSWELASTAAILLVVITVIVIVAYNRTVGRLIERRFG
ncbi:MAG: ABC transporter permease [Armatimonadota bacterium]|nr:ABC transporter permease [Armatimonadota bacterium]MDR7519598.1 ABC transporter permease [Armatimonadota bacterium]MDR7549067.1 ABC transporter permease [Armatimonadota bacterium]